MEEKRQKIIDVLLRYADYRFKTKLQRVLFYDSKTLKFLKTDLDKKSRKLKEKEKKLNIKL